MSLIDDIGQVAADALVHEIADAIVGVFERATASDDPIATARFEAQLQAHRIANEHVADLILAAKRKAGVT